MTAEVSSITTGGQILIVMVGGTWATILAAVAAYIKSNNKWRNTVIEKFGVLDVHLAESNIVKTQIDSRFQHIEFDVTELKKSVPQIKEAIAVVVNEFEKHETWHTKQN